MSTTEQELAAERARRQQEAFSAFLSSREYREAVAQETDGRDYAWITLPYVVCGIKLRPITARDLLVLFNLRTPFLSSAFLSGERAAIAQLPTAWTSDFHGKHVYVNPNEVKRFLWVQSYAFKECDGGLFSRTFARIKKEVFIWKCRNIKYGDAIEQIREFVNDALGDKPSGGSGPNTESITSWVAGDVHLIASRYGWTADYIVNLPLGQLFQCERRIIAEAGNGAALSNRTSSLRAKFLREWRSAD